ncbi:hypothetical protein AGRO_3695 [Agrobacterium sp. ATCC 31749]|nr:hypothetical protein AGRO_3695 [Agrobacterium sp. ATCC 31749]
MSRVQAVVYETHVSEDENCRTVIMASSSYESSAVTDYNDEVTHADIVELHSHAASKFGTPKFVKSSEAAW